MLKSYSYFCSKNISIYAIFNDQSFNDMLTNDTVSFEQLGPGDNSNLFIYLFYIMQGKLVVKYGPTYNKGTL